MRLFCTNDRRLHVVNLAWHGEHGIAEMSTPQVRKSRTTHKPIKTWIHRPHLSTMSPKHHGLCGDCLREPKAETPIQQRQCIARIGVERSWMAGPAPGVMDTVGDVILGNFVPSREKSLHKGEFVRVSAPIGMEVMDLSSFRHAKGRLPTGRLHLSKTTRLPSVTWSRWLHILTDPELRCLHPLVLITIELVQTVVGEKHDGDSGTGGRCSCWLRSETRHHRSAAVALEYRSDVFFC
jgi:hypothetical protein